MGNLNLLLKSLSHQLHSATHSLNLFRLVARQPEFHLDLLELLLHVDRFAILLSSCQSRV